MRKRRSVSDAQGSVKLTKADGTPLSEKEEVEAERLYRIYWETLPKTQFLKYTLVIEPLKEWLSVKFDALYDLCSLFEPRIIDHEDREVFVDFFVQSSVEFLQKHLAPALNAAAKMVAVSMHDQVPADVAKIGGMPTDEAERRLLVTRKKLKSDFETIFQGVIKKLPHIDGRGGDRKGGAKLTEGERIFIAERKTALMPFWTYLISQFEKYEYDYETWAWLNERPEFKEKCAEHLIASLHFLNPLIPEILKRKSGRRVESLSPAAFALRHAALELGVSDNYANLKKKVGEAGRAKQPMRKPRAREIKK